MYHYQIYTSNRYWIWGFMLLLFQGCVQDVKNVALPSSDPKLVISCFISPEDRFIKANVRMSQPIYGTSIAGSAMKDVTDAEVHLSNGQISIPMVYAIDPSNNKNMCYFNTNQGFPFAIVPGQTYYLEVKTPDGKICTASTTVPVHYNKSVSVVVDSMPSGTNNGVTFQLGVQLSDPVETRDNYRVNISWSTNGISSTRLINRFLPVINDEGNNGGTIFLRDNQHYSFSSGSPKQLTIDLAVIDDHFYKYNHSLESYSDDNPFAEPTLLYSNINNGLGIFASYLTYSKQFNY